jgi:peptidyl-prolyl cis-trans isomerase D
MLDEVRAQVEEDFRHDESIRLAQDKAKKLAERAKTQDFDRAAMSLGLTARTSNEFSQNEKVEGLGSGSQLSDAFTLKPGELSGVISTGSNLALFKVISRTLTNDADFAAQRDKIAEELLDQKRDRQFETYCQNLKEQFLRSGKLKINDAAMKEFLASNAVQ